MELQSLRVKVRRTLGIVDDMRAATLSDVTWTIMQRIPA